MTKFEKKPRMNRRALTKAAVVGLLASSALNPLQAEASSAGVGQAGRNASIERIQKNVMPRVIGGVLRMCDVYPTHCSLKPVGNGDYSVNINGVPDLQAPGYHFDAFYTAKIETNEPKDFSVDRVYDGSIQMSVLKKQQEMLCDSTTMGDVCIGSTMSAGLFTDRSMFGSSTPTAVGTFQGLGLATDATAGNFTTSWGNTRNFIVHDGGTEFLAALAAGTFEHAGQVAQSARQLGLPLKG